MDGDGGFVFFLCRGAGAIAVIWGGSARQSGRKWAMEWQWLGGSGWDGLGGSLRSF
jgi:hypothetical protein